MSDTAHQSLVSGQFGGHAKAYVTSAVHAQGADLERMDGLLAAHPGGVALDLGTGGGHVAFHAAAHCRQVVAFDLSADMLAVVAAEAARRDLDNITGQQGSVESLPFADASFDWVLSRYSAHHWPALCRAMVEARRVIKPDGHALFMDVVAPAEPLFDTWLQSLELMRDPGHLRNRTIAQWTTALEDAHFRIGAITPGRIRLDFASWVARIGTPEPLVAAIRLLQQVMPGEVARHFALEDDGSFQLDIAQIEAVPV